MVMHTEVQALHLYCNLRHAVRKFSSVKIKGIRITSCNYSLFYKIILVPVLSQLIQFLDVARKLCAVYISRIRQTEKIM